jgi:hypothetical protein
MKLVKFSNAAPLSLLLVPLLLVVPAAYASEGQEGSRDSGTFTTTIVTATTPFSSGGYTLYYFTATAVFSGAISGNAVASLYLLVAPSGTDVALGTLTCGSCSLNGQTGTLSTVFTAQGTFGGSGTGTAPWVGSGGLAGFHALGTFQFVTTATGFTGPYQLHLNSHEE